MPIRFAPAACCLLMIVSCTGVHVDAVNVEDPTVNIDATANVDAKVDATANVDANATVPVQPTDSGSNEQPAADPAPTKAVTPALEREAAQPEAEPAIEPAPCADSDSDGVCDAADICPAGSDADADGTGYADGCERELWSTSVWVSPAPNTLTRNYVANQPAVLAIEPLRHTDCLSDSDGYGLVAIELPQHFGAEPLVVRMPRPEAGRGGKMVECLEAGIDSTTLAGLKGSTGGWSSSFTDRLALPAGSAGAHIVYFEVHLDEYGTVPASPYGTVVTAFRAVVSARGY
jgi:hypothetical protein